MIAVVFQQATLQRAVGSRLAGGVDGGIDAETGGVGRVTVLGHQFTTYHFRNIGGGDLPAWDVVAAGNRRPGPLAELFLADHVRGQQTGQYVVAPINGATWVVDRVSG